MVLPEPLHQPLEEGRRRAQLLLLLHLVPPSLPLLAPRLPNRRLLLLLCSWWWCVRGILDKGEEDKGVVVCAWSSTQKMLTIGHQVV